MSGNAVFRPEPSSNANFRMATREEPQSKRCAVTEDPTVGGPSLWLRAIIFLPAVPSHALHVFQPRKFRCSGQEPPRPILLRRPKSIDRVRTENRFGNTAGVQPRGS